MDLYVSVTSKFLIRKLCNKYNLFQEHHVPDETKDFTVINNDRTISDLFSITFNLNIKLPSFKKYVQSNFFFWHMNLIDLNSQSKKLNNSK